MRLVTCLVAQHNLWLVAVAAILCGLGSWTTLRLYWHMRSRAAAASGPWIFLGAVAAGATVWCTHFIAMLAYVSSAPIAYNPGLTGLSLIVAIITAALGLRVAAFPHRLAPLFGGALLGGGIAAMHYTGMAAFAVDAVVIWDRWYVAASLICAISLGAIAMNLAASADTTRLQVAAISIFILAIIGLHFTAMAAMTIVPLAPTGTEITNDAARQFLGLAVAGIGLLVVGTGMASHIVDQQTREQAGARQRYLVEGSVDGMVVEQAGCITDLNATFEELTGRPRAELLGHSVTEWLTSLPEQGADTLLNSVLCAADGSVIPVEVVTRRGSLGDSDLVVYAVRDLRSRLAQEQKIVHLARNDSLTGLANRYWFREEMDIALRRVGRDKPLAVLCLDLDCFKQINDTLGHPIGDRLLHAVAQRIKQNLRNEDVVARMGGDEFAIIQIGAEQPAGASSLAQRLIDKISEPYQLEGHQAMVGTSIGVSIAPIDGIDPDELLKKADLALYRAKSDGRGMFQLFEPGMDEAVRLRRCLESDLKKALASGEFELFYQPQVDASTRAVCSFEALLRWRHPERGLVSPLDFIPVAEEIGLMGSIGGWVLHQACLDAKSWPENIGVAVNVSPAQFQNNTLENDVLAALNDSGLSPLRLELEITESILLENTERVIDIMSRLRARGIRIAMDDFGTGYSSLSYLSRFPIDKIKIDRSFVKGSSDNTSSLAVIRAVVGLSASLGMKSTGEGVETPDQLALLKAEGCSEVQGYYFSKPIPIAAIPGLLESLSTQLEKAA